MSRRVLVTGGAGFVGANLAVALATRHPDWEVVALDNLRRRGSELNLPRLAAAGVAFRHGDVRDPADLDASGALDAILECSAEPSALAGTSGDTPYVVQSNLVGAWHCLELARRHGAQLLFLSTSRVYPIDPLRALAMDEGPDRFELRDDQPVAGVSPAGVSEAFPLEGARTLYGATKLGAELLIAEYHASFGLRTVVDRCGVIAGPWQMGRVDQGVFAWWMLAHYRRRPLRYIGFGGTGKQVRDLLHVDDLTELVDQQLGDPDGWAGATVNVGGGRERSLSLLETTALCREITGNTIAVEGDAEDRAGDVPVYLSDCRRLEARTTWRPRRSARDVLVDIFDWIHEHDARLRDAQV